MSGARTPSVRFVVDLSIYRGFVVRLKLDVPIRNERGLCVTTAQRLMFNSHVLTTCTNLTGYVELDPYRTPRSMLSDEMLMSGTRDDVVDDIARRCVGTLTTRARVAVRYLLLPVSSPSLRATQLRRRIGDPSPGRATDRPER